MESLIAIGSLILTGVMMLIINCLGTYEYLFNMPKWFADPPASFEALRQQTKRAKRYWIPIQLLFIIAYIAALISNWHLDSVRPFVVYAGIAFVLIIISTATYFAPEVIAFSKIPTDVRRTDDLVKKTKKWYKTSVARNVLQLIVLLLILIATYKNLTL